MNKRIPFFDTTKGLLMLFLIWGHLLIFAQRFQISTDFSRIIQFSTPFYRVFFMQTFFFITGFCTSWKISVGSFLLKNFKTIVLPAFIFIPFSWLTSAFCVGDYSVAALRQEIIRYCTGHLPWFISALFISKIFFFVIKRLNITLGLQWGVFASVFMVGLCVKELTSCPNFFYFQNASVMLPFMALGNMVKEIENGSIYMPIDSIYRHGGILSNKVLFVISVPYFFIVALWQVLGLKLAFPAVDYFVSIDFITAPFHIIFAVSGTALIFIVAKHLTHLSVLSLLGRQSLFVYLIHGFVVCGLMKLYNIVFDVTESMMSGMIFYITIYLLSLALILAGCRLMENKRFGWMVGKF